MAYQPCVSCSRNFYGGASFSYITWFEGEDRYSYRMRQCGACAAELRNGILDVADRRSGADWVFATSDSIVSFAPPPAAAGERVESSLNVAKSSSKSSNGKSA